MRVRRFLGCKETAGPCSCPKTICPALAGETVMPGANLDVEDHSSTFCVSPSPHPAWCGTVVAQYVQRVRRGIKNGHCLITCFLMCRLQGLQEQGQQDRLYTTELAGHTSPGRGMCLGQTLGGRSEDEEEAGGFRLRSRDLGCSTKGGGYLGHSGTEERQILGGLEMRRTPIRGRIFYEGIICNQGRNVGMN